MNQELQKLAEEKRKAREKVLKLSPKEAQTLVNQTLYPEYWELDITENSWEESIPTNYGKTDT
jgi:hypothetical protein